MCSANHTHFLSAQRSSGDEIKKSYSIFSSLPYVKVVIDAVSSIAMIIDKNRQIIYANKKLTDTIGEENFENILGLRPGELLNCKHALNSHSGCGTSEACKYCGAALSIKQSIEEAIITENECRITVEKQGQSSNLDLLVTASPIIIENEQYIILSIADISNEKRRKILERVFFHDIVNTAGGLKGILRFLKENHNPEQNDELISIASLSAEQLMDEILMQRMIVAAENGELIIAKKPVNPSNILKDVRDLMASQDMSLGIHIEIKEKQPNVVFHTDPVILKRILINLLKNAIEASTQGSTVTIGFHTGIDTIDLYVQNDSVLTEEVKLQIFQRSFSTKGNDRGIGTYSIKLLTESYLNGKVSFSSTEADGTIFTISLPLKQEEQK